MVDGIVGPESGKPRIGLIAENDLNRHLLAGLLGEAGYELALSLNTDRLAKKLATAGNTLDNEVDAWLLDSAQQEITSAIDLLEENSALPLLVNDDIPPLQDIAAHQYWKRRLVKKLELVVVRNTGSPSALNSAEEPERIWILAASFGGPEAVKRFLAALSPKLPIAMVYGQHIEKNFDQVLTNAIAANQDYAIRLVRGHSQLSRGELVVIPADRQVRFPNRGQVIETRHAWEGDYQPALDQIISELARVYRERLSIIIFSGMCNDGEIGCRVAKACGSTIWVQSPETCMSPDMPNAALKTGGVSFQGSPEQLAKAAAEYTLKNSAANKTSVSTHHIT